MQALVAVVILPATRKEAIARLTLLVVLTLLPVVQQSLARIPGVPDMAIEVCRPIAVVLAELEVLNAAQPGRVLTSRRQLTLGELRLVFNGIT